LINLKNIARNLIEAENGVFTTQGHTDLGFALTDSTNWAEIEKFSYWYRHRNRCFVSLVQRFSPGGPIFEIGSGNGSVAIALQNTGLEVVGIEPTVNAAVTSRRRGLRIVVCARFEEAGFAPGALSNVGLFDVLEHVDDDARFVGQIRELMPSGGRIYCAVPAWKMLWSAEDAAAGHRRRYKLDGLAGLFEAARCEIEYASYFFTPLFLPIVIFRSIPGFVGLRTVRTPGLSRKEHTLPNNVVGSWLGSALDREARIIGQGKSRSLGASCLVVARAIG
jgi:SAM-dependent methyltransferase